MAERPTLVVVGAASRDIDALDARGWKLGGGVTYSAMAAARLGAKVFALVGVDPLAATASELDALRKAGVQLRLAPLEHGPVFDNRRTPTGRQQFALSASDAMSVESLPEDWRKPDAALLAPVAGELHHDWSAPFAPATFVTLAVQGMLRRLHAGEEVVRLAFEHGPLVDRADAIALSREDVVAGAPPLRDWTRPGQHLLVTHGKRGSLHLVRTEDRLEGRYMPPMPRRKALDPTGAGDTFVAAWLTTQLLVGGDWRPQAVASVMSSLAVLTTSVADMPGAADVCRELVKLRP